MSKEFSVESVFAGSVETKHRRIVTPLPNPESLETLKKLNLYEPRSMQGQPPIVWDRAEGAYIYDKLGNKWIDFSSGVLVANAGHAAPEVRAAICSTAAKGLLHTYCFPNEPRAQLVELLSKLAPEPLSKVLLLSTGSEAVEAAIKLARAYGRQKSPNKINIISFQNAFHGRTLGAQLVGGIPHLKEWIGVDIPGFYQVPFPDGFRNKEQSFTNFVSSLRRQGVEEDSVAAVITETFQGGGASFAPTDYMQNLAEWCRKHEALLILDEIQAGFGRTGTFWGFEHYSIIPDIICCGKGISGSLPVSAVISKPEIMDTFNPGEMSSTHSGNPICCAAAVANIQTILREGLVEKARELGEKLHKRLKLMKERFSTVIGAIHGKGLVAGIHVVKPKSEEPDGVLASRVVIEAVRRGVMLFAPVGYGGATIKICPPLVIEEDALMEGIDVLEEAFSAALEQT